MSDQLDDYIRQEVDKNYVSDCLTVDQDLINQFAETTRD